jgi:hypothetical protein
VPKILVVGGNGNQGILESLGSLLMDKLDSSTADSAGTADSGYSNPETAKPA